VVGVITEFIPSFYLASFDPTFPKPRYPIDKSLFEYTSSTAQFNSAGQANNRHKPVLGNVLKFKLTGF
jgi:hypothetical protein